MAKTPKGYEHLADAARSLKAQARIAARIEKQNPTLGFMTAIIMAGDELHARRVDKVFQAGGLTFRQASHFIGSYARLSWALRQLRKGKVTAQEIYADLPFLWSGSDPDDLNPRYLKLWRDAFKANGSKYIRDGKGLPRASQLVVYRGQDRDEERLGIAWSLDYWTARKFAKGAWVRQSHRDGVVITGRVARVNVLGYLTGRGEAEIITDPKAVLVLGREEV